MSTTPPNPDHSATDNRAQPLLSVRTTLVLLLAGLSATGVAVLLLHAQHSPAEITLASAATGAAAIRFFHWLIA